MRRLGVLLVSLGLLGGVLAGCDSAPEDGRFLYVVRAPFDRDGFRDLKPSIEVHDIADGHRLVRVIPLPSGTMQVRGVAASAGTDRLYISHFGRYAEGINRDVGGKMLALDLRTGGVLWERTYKPGVDRMAITPDGSKIYMPQSYGWPDYWHVIDAANGDVVDRVTHVPSTHNTITSLDGRFAFLQAIGGSDPAYGSDVGGANPRNRSIALVDRATNDIVRLIGPFRERTRPFTVNGRGTVLYATVNDLIGFQVADVATGRVLYTARPPATYAQPPATNDSTFAHGIALTADESTVYVVDQKLVGVHVFDVRGVPGSAPVYVKTIKLTNRGDIYGEPAWISSSFDGRYIYPESGEIIDAATRTVVGRLQDALGRNTHSRYMVEVDLVGGDVTRVGDQFGVGRNR